MVFRKLWETLGLHEIIDSLLDDREITINIQEAIFCMVLNRLTEPLSKLGVSMSNGKPYLSFVQGYRQNGKVKQKTEFKKR
jgi:hypothetical protein